MICLDFETHRTKPGMVAPRPVCLAWVDGDFPEWAPKLYDRAAAYGHLKDLLESDIHLLGHNIAFDLGVACAEWPDLLGLVFEAYDEGRVRDTLVRQHLIDIAHGEHKFRVNRMGKATKTLYGLAALVEHHLGKHLEKEDTYRLKYGELDGTPIDAWPDDAISYPIGDVTSTLEVFDAQQTACGIKERGTYITNEREQTYAAWGLYLMGSWGIRTDGQAVEHLREVLEAARDVAMEKLIPTGLVRPDGSRYIKAIQERVERAYMSMGKRPPRTEPSKKFPEGQVQYGEEVLLSTGDADLIILGQSMQGMTLLNNYVPKLAWGVERPICPKWNVLVESGRTSCAEPNLQNPPTFGGVRECYVPRQNFWFAGADYDTIELRSHAQNCLDMFGHSQLAVSLQQGLDPHLALAADFMGITYERAQALRATGDDHVEEMRALAKVANFGFPGGLGPDAFMDYAGGYGLTLDKVMSRRIYDQWLRSWPENPEYFVRIKSMVGPVEGTITQLPSGRKRGGVDFPAACNTFFQGRTADGAKAALCRLAKECYLPGSDLYGSRPVIFMHDEFILEVPAQPELAHRAALRLSLVMREEMQRLIPDIPIKAGPVLMRRWYKGAKALERDGLLRPVRPVKEAKRTLWVEDTDEAERLAA